MFWGSRILLSCWLLLGIVESVGGMIWTERFWFIIPLDVDMCTINLDNLATLVIIPNSRTMLAQVEAIVAVDVIELLVLPAHLCFSNTADACWLSGANFMPAMFSNTCS